MRRFTPAERTNFDPKADRAAKKALTALDGIRESLHVKLVVLMDDPDHEFREEFHIEAAIDVIDAAVNAVYAELNCARAKAARENNEYGVYLRFCARRNITPASGRD